MAILYGFAARCLFGVVFLHKANMAGDCRCSLDSQISPASKNRAPIHHERAKSLRPGQSLISSPRNGHIMRFLWTFFGKFLVLGNLTCAQKSR